MNLRGGVTMGFEMEDGMPEDVMLDELRITQVISNGLTNAIKVSVAV